MKKTSLLRNVFSLMAAFALVAADSWAADLRWDSNGSGAGISNLAGNWSSSATTWTNTTANTSVAWTSGTDNAQFGGTGSTGAGGIITVDAGGVTVNNVLMAAPTSGNFDLQGGTITLNGSMTNSGTNNSTNTCVIAGSGSVTRSSGGRFMFLAQNTYSGTTTINSGAGIQLGDSTHVGTFGQGDVTNNGTIYAMGTGTYTIANKISGTGALTKSFSSTIIMSGALGFSGTITAIGGDIRMNNIPNGGTNRIAYNGGAVTCIGASNGTSDRLIQIGTTANSTVAATLGNDGAGTLDMTGTGAITTGVSVASGAGLKLQGSNTGDNHFRSLINDLGGVAIKFAKDGAGKWILDNASNNFTGGSTITAGTLSFASGALGTSGAVTMNGGTLQWASGNTDDLSGRLTMVSGKTATLDTNGNDVSFGSAIGSSTTGALTKTGSGMLTLAGANTYTGATSVNNGTLRLDGSLTSAVTVASGATLQGSGSTTGGLIISGTVAPGNSIESLGVGADGVTFNATSTFAYELNSTEFGGDLLYTTGGLSIVEGAELTLADLGDATLTSGKLTLISYTGTWVDTQLFKYGLTALADDSQVTIGSNTWLFNYNDTTGGTNFSDDQTGGTRFMTLTVIPEPGTAGVVATFLAAALLRRRRFR